MGGVQSGETPNASAAKKQSHRRSSTTSLPDGSTVVRQPVQVVSDKHGKPLVNPNFPGRERYSNWRLHDVKAAWVRATALAPMVRRQQVVLGCQSLVLTCDVQRCGPTFSDGTHIDKGRRMELTRRQFWEVFTDYQVVCGREWLSLPLDQFYLYLDKPTDTKIDAVEVLMMLALFSQGTPDEALAFCFQVFDEDRSRVMELVSGHCRYALGSTSVAMRPDVLCWWRQDEMEHFLWVLGNAAYKIGLVKTKPVLSYVLSLAKDMVQMADADKDGEIACPEFVEWMLSHVMTGRIVSTLKKLRARDRAHRRQMQLLREARGDEDGSAVQEAPSPQSPPHDLPRPAIQPQGADDSADVTHAGAGAGGSGGAGGDIGSEGGGSNGAKTPQGAPAQGVADGATTPTGSTSDMEQKAREHQAAKPNARRRSRRGSVASRSRRGSVRTGRRRMSVLGVGGGIFFPATDILMRPGNTAEVRQLWQ